MQMKPINMYKILVFVNLRRNIFVKLLFPKEQFADTKFPFERVQDPLPKRFN